MIIVLGSTTKKKRPTCREPWWPLAHPQPGLDPAGHARPELTASERLRDYRICIYIYIGILEKKMETTRDY